MSSALITTFFKSAHGGDTEQEGADAVHRTSSAAPASDENRVLRTAPVSNGGLSLGGVYSDSESSRCSLGGGSEGGGGEGGGGFAVNLCGLLNGEVGLGMLSGGRHGHMISSPTTSSAPNPCQPQILETENLTSGTPSALGSQSTLTWDTSSGTLSVKPSATQLPAPLASEMGAGGLGGGGGYSVDDVSQLCGNLVAEVDGCVEEKVVEEGRCDGGRGRGGKRVRNHENRSRKRGETGVCEVREQLNGQRRERQKDGKVDYQEMDDAGRSELTGQRRRSKRRQHQTDDSSSQQATCDRTRRLSLRKKNRKRGSDNERELTVRIKRCHLHHVPGSSEHEEMGHHSGPGHEEMGRHSGAGHEEMGRHSGAGREEDTASDVEITHCVVPAVGGALDESVVIIAATSPPANQPPSQVTSASIPPPQPPSSSSSSLSGAWAKIFRQPASQKPTGCKPTSDAVPTSLDNRCSVSGQGSPARSPKRQRSTSCSPHRCNVPRSPRACRSPRRGSPLRSPRKGTLTPASPLKSSLKPRKLLPFTPPLAKRTRLDCDYAPFADLVHVRQESCNEPLWTLTPGESVLNTRPLTPAPLHVPSQFSLKSCVESPELRGPASPQETPLGPASPQETPLLPIPPDQREACLGLVVDAHPHEKVRQIFQRYCKIHDYTNLKHHTLTTPHSHSLTVSHHHKTTTKRKHRRPLVCRIHIVNRENRPVQVDSEVYVSKSGRRRSLRLTRRRSVTSEVVPGELQVEVGRKTQADTSSTTRSELSDRLAGDRKSKGERGECCDLWTELYRPRSGAEVIGNEAGVQQLLGWLQIWKDKCSNQKNLSDGVTLPAKQKRQRKNPSEMSGNLSRCSRENSPMPEWARREGGDDFRSLTHVRRRRKRLVLSHSSESEEEEEGGCGEVEGEGVTSVLLLCGPTGCGKTAAVYACAAELGFKVFEVNSSSVRSRGSLLATLKEATLSHQVSTQPTTAPCRQPLTESARMTAGNRMSSEGGVKKAGERAQGGLLSFFKPQGRREGEEAVRGVAPERGGTLSTSDNSRLVSLETNTVILLEEVDILFDSDRRFWDGVYELTETTKRPIILTCNDSRYDLSCDHIKIVFEKPSLVELGMHMQLLCLSHDYHMTSKAAVQLAGCLHADIRRVFLSLQFWITPSTSTHHTPTSTPHTPHPSLNHIAALPALSYCTDASETSPSLLPPSLPLPWRPSRNGPLRPSTLTHRDMDMASYHAEQCSYVDIVTMERKSHDCHMMSVNDVVRPWWVCPEEPNSVIDELPVRECRWREEEVTCDLCDEVERRVGGMVRCEPINNWAKFTRHVGSVRQCLKSCAELFSLHGNRVGVVTDGLPLLRTICSSECHRKMDSTKRRFRHYLQSCVVDQSDLQTLPLETRFPSS